MLVEGQTVPISEAVSHLAGVRLALTKEKMLLETPTGKLYLILTVHPVLFYLFLFFFFFSDTLGIPHMRHKDRVTNLTEISLGLSLMPLFLIFLGARQLS